jgi:hypothetical protein
MLVLEASTSLRVQILFMVVLADRAVTGARGSQSVGASRAGQVWIHSMLSKVRFGFAQQGSLDLGSFHRGGSDLGAIHAMQAGQVWVSFMLYK